MILVVAAVGGVQLLPWRWRHTVFLGQGNLLDGENANRTVYCERENFYLGVFLVFVALVRLETVGCREGFFTSALPTGVGLLSYKKLIVLRNKGAASASRPRCIT